MATSPFLTQRQFKQLPQMQQRAQLQKRFQHLLDQQEQVNSVLKTCRNYEDMIAPYNDANSLNRTLRKYMRVYIDPNMTLKHPGMNEVFTLTKLDKLCHDAKRLLQRFLAAGKPGYTLSGLMYVKEELHEEQQRIISKYKTDYNWKDLLPEVDLALRPQEKARRRIEL